DEKSAYLYLDTARRKQVSGDLGGAVTMYEKFLKIFPRHASALQLAGTAYLLYHKPEKAAKALERATILSPKNADAHFNLGLAYAQIGKKHKSIKSYRTAINLDPNLGDAYFNLGRIYFTDENYAEAISLYLKALEINPSDFQCRVNLGNAYTRSSGTDPKLWHLAWREYEKALQINPNIAEAYGNIGALFRSVDWHSLAIPFYDLAMKVDPANQEHRFIRSGLALSLGDFETGWDDYEARSRFGKKNIRRRPVPPHYWNGEDLKGKRLLIWREQGLGDQIIFSSMIRHVLDLGAHVTLDIHPRLAKVFARSFPGVELLKDTAEGESEIKKPNLFDYQIALGSLGRFFRRRFEDFPRHQGYIKADPDKVARFRAKYQALAKGNRLVGISWQSKREGRFGELKSAPLMEWAEILRTPDVTFVNLQYGDCRAELADVKKNLGIEIYQDTDVNSMGDLDDFVAQVAALDLVLSTSNTTVHVAGSLNVPCWIMPPRGGALLWYWFLERTDNPWYPSVKLYRPLRFEDLSDRAKVLANWWIAPLGRMARDLSAWRSSAVPDASPMQPA
ncbi:MAG: tetratricopeptide repeat protein, partial [Rhodobacteraceae bacterium]|nr:tetratricopeptide repeat protein [Paracoccaceae bacterium]